MGSSAGVTKTPQSYCEFFQGCLHFHSPKLIHSWISDTNLENEGLLCFQNNMALIFTRLKKVKISVAGADFFYFKDLHYFQH